MSRKPIRLVDSKLKKVEFKSISHEQELSDLKEIQACAQKLSELNLDEESAVKELTKLENQIKKLQNKNPAIETNYYFHQANLYLGVVFFKHKMFSEATKRFLSSYQYFKNADTTSSVLLQKTEDPEFDFILSSYYLGLCAEQVNDMDQAILYYKEVTNRPNSKKYPLTLSENYYHLAICYYCVHEHGNFSTMAKKAIKQMRLLYNKDAEYKENYAKMVYELGLISIGQSDFKDAIKLFSCAFQLFNVLNDRDQLGLVYADMSIAYILDGQRDKAIKRYDKAIELFGKLSQETSRRIIAAGFMMGRSLYMEGNFSTAIILFEKLQKLLSPIKTNKVLALKAYVDLALSLCFLATQNKEAEMFAKSALQNFQSFSAKASETEMTAILKLARPWVDNADFEKKLDIYRVIRAKIMATANSPTEFTADCAQCTNAHLCCLPASFDEAFNSALLRRSSTPSLLIFSPRKDKQSPAASNRTITASDCKDQKDQKPFNPNPSGH